MKSVFSCLTALLLLASCSNPQNSEFKIQPSPCAEALIAYAERYPAAEPQDLYKLVFQDLYGPGHLLTDSLAAVRYIGREVEEMPDDSSLLAPHSSLPLYEYTLCDSHFVRVNLLALKRGTLQLGPFVSALLRSTEGLPTPDPRFVMSHSQAFKEAYHPHYRIIRRDIFEREILPILQAR